MQNRFLFRDRRPVRQVGPGRGDLVFTVVAVAAMLTLLAWGHSADQHDDDAQRAFEAGLVAGRDEMIETVGDAYRRGRIDALADQQHQASQPAADVAGTCPLPVAPLVQRRGGLL